MKGRLYGTISRGPGNGASGLNLPFGATKSPPESSIPLRLGRFRVLFLSDFGSGTHRALQAGG